jgi:hypothetical protein
MADKKATKPVLKPEVTVTHNIISTPVLATGQYLIVKTKDGKELPETEITVSLRMFNQIYSKQSYIIKKK